MAVVCRKPDPRGTPYEKGSSAVPTDMVFTIDDLVEYLKLPKSTAYKLEQEGVIPGQKVGKHWRFRKNAIDRWLDKRELGISARPTSTRPKSNRRHA